MKKKLFIQDVKRFCEQNGKREFQFTINELGDRITNDEFFFSQDTKISGETTGKLDRYYRPVLHLRLTGTLQLVCQNCLHTVPYPLEEDADLTIFPDDESIEKITNKDLDIDGIIIPNYENLDLKELIEDQILLAVPYSPRHEICEQATLPDKKNEQSTLPNNTLKS